MRSWNLGIFADLSIEAIWISVALCASGEDTKSAVC